jgi:oxygen-independent coproporphyrinogen-3 oxidase
MPGLYFHIPFCRKRCHFCYFRVYTDKNAIDEAQSAASIERLTKLLGACAGLKVDLVATGAVDSAKTRAESLKKFMEGKGGKGKIGKASGAEGDGSTKVVVTAPCK